MYDSCPKKFFLNIDHLGLVAGTCDFLGIKDFIDSRIPKRSNNYKLSNGEIFVCMIVNALGFTSKAMYLYPEYFEGVDVKHLFGEHFDISYINDDAVVRMLEGIYDYGLDKLYLELGEMAIAKLGYKPNYLHLDSTSFHVHGEKYDNFRRITIGKDDCEHKESIDITQGYSRDAHPELPQVMLQMIADNISGLPLFMKPQDGNTNDSKGFQSSFDIVKSLMDSMKKSNESPYLVCDAALYTEPNLEVIREQYNNELKFITRAPGKIKKIAEIIKQAERDGLEPIEEHYSGRMYDFELQGVKQKLLVVHSDHAVERSRKAVESQSQKELKKINTALEKLGKKEFNCEPDAIKAYESLLTKLQFTKASQEKANVEPIPVYGKGRKSSDSQPIRYKYFVHGSVELDQDAIEQEKKAHSCFVIATNDAEKDWSMIELFRGYKSQQRVERGFRFLKDPEFFADSIFLKTPRRIESLLMVMVSTLLIHSATEYLLRKNLKDKNLTVKNQLKKEIQNPTMRWVYSVFSMFHIGRFFNGPEDFDYSEMKEEQKKVIRALSGPWLKIYKPFMYE